MVKLKAFKKILRTTQPQLKTLLRYFLERLDYKPTSGDGFLYAEGNIPILLVSHLDIVHYTPPEDIYFDQEQKVVWSPTGIGGDDRCGVYMICELLTAGYRPHVLFLEDEEKGGIGAGKCVKVLEKPKLKFMVELDRRGEDDCVFYSCDNKDFIKYIESFGFVKAHGTFTDICTLSKSWDIASVNLSSGYFCEHNKHEYIKLDCMDKTIERVKKILDDTDETYYDYQPYVYNYNYNWKSSKKKEEKTEKEIMDEIGQQISMVTFDEYFGFPLSDLDEYPYMCDGCAYYTYGFIDKDKKYHSYSEFDDEPVQK